ncbi:hypothetical protein OAC37_02690 [Amylibacter sp.]|nr:hypothetical protein [Amylibacter sp.]
MKIIKDLIAVISSVIIFLVMKIFGNNFTFSKDCTIIIFSKDRVPQLDLLLRSILENTLGHRQIIIMYRASTVQAYNSYNKLTKKYLEHEIIFRDEASNDFRSSLQELVKMSDSKTLCLLVDDDVFYRPFDFSMFDGLSALEYQPSLRLGFNITRSWILGIDKMLTPGDIIAHNEQQEIYEWQYRKAAGDWGYSFSLDGNFYHREIFRIILSLSRFHNPNSLEASLQKFRYFNPWLKGVALKFSVLFNNPSNKVQNENNNASFNNDIELLDELYARHGSIKMANFSSERVNSVHTYFEFE